MRRSLVAPRRRAAAALAAVTVLGTAVVATAVPALAAASDTNTQKLYCWVNGISSSPAQWNAAADIDRDMALVGSPTSAITGDSVDVTVSFSAGPGNGPFQVSQTTTVLYKITTPGGSEIVEGDPSAAYLVAANAPAAPAGSVTDSLVLSEAGATTIAVHGYRFDGTTTGGPPFGGLSSFTTCNAGSTNPETTPVTTDLAVTLNVVGPSFSISSIEGQRAGVTTAARPGEAINVALTDFPDGAASVALCTAATGGTCGTAVPLTVASGAASGAVDVADDATPGTTYVRVTSGSVSLSKAVKVLGDRALTADPDSGPVGTSVTLEGSGFDPASTVTIDSLDAEGEATDAASDEPQTVTVGADGTFEKTRTVNDSDTVEIVAAETDAGATPAEDQATVGFEVTASTPSPSPTEPPTSAKFGTATADFGCIVTFAGGDSGLPESAWKPKLTAALSGTTLDLTYDKGIKNGPVFTVPPGTNQSIGSVTVGGKDATLTSPKNPATIGTSIVFPSATMTGTVTDGDSVGVKTIKFDDLSTNDADVTCTPKAPLTITLKTVELPAEVPDFDGPLTVTGDLVPGGVVTVSGSGLDPSSDVNIAMYSTPVLLTQTTTDASGAFSTTATIPASTTVGEHSMVALGEVDGEVSVLGKVVTVGAATDTGTGGNGGTGGGGELAATGLATWKIALIAAILLQIGMVIWVRSHRALALRAPAQPRHRLY